MELPTTTYDKYWLCEVDYKITNNSHITCGKFMLFYDRNEMDKAWVKATKMFRLNKFEGVNSIKCSTSKETPRASNNTSGVIIFYIDESKSEDYILNCGRIILEVMEYTKQKIIYFKTSDLTHNGTRALGQTKNYKYKLYNKYWVNTELNGVCWLKP